MFGKIKEAVKPKTNKKLENTTAKVSVENIRKKDVKKI